MRCVYAIDAGSHHSDDGNARNGFSQRGRGHILHFISCIHASETLLTYMMQMNDISKRNEFYGDVLSLVKAIIDVPNGGMVFMDAKTCSGISSSLVELLMRVNSQSDFMPDR